MPLEVEVGNVLTVDYGDELANFEVSLSLGDHLDDAVRQASKCERTVAVCRFPGQLAAVHGTGG